MTPGMSVVAWLTLSLSVTAAAQPGISAGSPAGSPAGAPAGAQAVTLVGAGDIARCESRRDEATARLLDAIGGTVFTTGDNAYPDGSASHFASCYGPSWGRHRDRTRPSPGNHDYHTAEAAGYFGYFGTRAGPNDRGWYAYRRGTWRIYSLNSEVLSDAQLAWLRADLAAHTPHCSLAYWHRPLFSSGRHGGFGDARRLWRPLYRAGVELVINGHDHDYERFAGMRPDGSRSWRGIREFVVGTGGAKLRSFGAIEPHSVERNATSHGVLKLRLKDGAYAWRFVSVGGRYSDTGSARCHGRP